MYLSTSVFMYNMFVQSYVTIKKWQNKVFVASISKTTRLILFSIKLYLTLSTMDPSAKLHSRQLSLHTNRISHILIHISFFIVFTHFDVVIVFV